MNEITNNVYVQGEVITEPEYNHSVKDERFYSFKLKVDRLSNESDILPIMLSEKFLTMNNIKLGDRIGIHGQFRSHNKLEDGRSRLLLSVFCQEIVEWNKSANSNRVELSGYICKEPIYRKTPLNREICDLLIAVNRNNNKSDYIPCLAWGRNARFAASLKLGDRIELDGRIQSREYNKKMETGIEITRIAYEVSIANLASISNEDAL